MFMMNYIFNFPVRSGQFVENDSAAGVPVLGLPHSKAWLKLVPTIAIPEPGSGGIPNNWNPEAATWDDLGSMEEGSVYIPSTPPRTTAAMSDQEGNVGIRIAPDPASSVVLGPGGAKLELVVCFGKPSPSKQPRSSPFENSDGSPRTTWVRGPMESNRVFPPGHPNAGLPACWFFDLGFMNHRPGFNVAKHRIHTYEYSVGIIVTDPATGMKRHYSHDPEMDIGE